MDEQRLRDIADGLVRVDPVVLVKEIMRHTGWWQELLLQMRDPDMRGGVAACLAEGIAARALGGEKAPSK